MLAVLGVFCWSNIRPPPYCESTCSGSLIFKLLKFIFLLPVTAGSLNPSSPIFGILRITLAVSWLHILLILVRRLKATKYFCSPLTQLPTHAAAFGLLLCWLVSASKKKESNISLSCKKFDDSLNLDWIQRDLSALEKWNCFSTAGLHVTVWLVCEVMWWVFILD